MLTILFWVAVGLVLGWFVLPQPAWARSVYDSAVGFVKGLF